ncbi:MAG: PAS domain S-box protein [Cyanobacteria bacterium SZAS LIN-2]|nr:PAS domain S-box protein [Cyanobacteria bacterium SZAS LIN-3]MBS1995207.1 PAS domain S-box protein [Cyanobacteria bacterium SZAS LIN-2]
MRIFSNLSLARKVLILVFVPVFIELSFLATLYLMLEQSENERQRETHAREVAGQVNTLLRLMLEAGTASVLSYMTSSSSYYKRYRQLSADFNAEASKLGALVHNNTHERETYSRMAALNLTVMNELKTADEDFRRGDKQSSMTRWLKLQNDMNSLFMLADQLVEEQQALQKAKTIAQARARENVKVLMLVFALLTIAVAAVIVLYVNRGTTRRLQDLVENTRRLASSKPLSPPLLGEKDEISDLDKAFRDMAAALAEAVSKERAVLENAADVICTIDDEGRFITANPATLKLWGYTPEDLLGSRLSFVLPAEDAEKTLSALRELGRSRAEGTFEATVKRKDGGLCQTLWTARWSPAENALFCVVHDISERKRIENLKEEFVAMVSHELRTPLTSVQGFLSLLSAGAYAQLSQSGSESLVMAEQNVDRVIRLVNDILDVEKLNSGMLSFELADIGLNKLLNDSLNAVTAMADQKDLTLVCQPPRPELFVRADGERITQVLINLLSNAVKFSPEGKTVEVVALEMGPEVEVRVIDQGRGVPPQERSEIFERFHQVQAADGKGHHGTGLGLAISKALIERHGGTIGMSEGPSGVGSVFWFRLPRAAGDRSSS